MAVFALVHGAGGGAWDWHLVVPELERLGHEGVAVDLPGAADGDAGLDDLARTVVDAVGPVDECAVVGHSLGGVTASLAADRLPARLLVLVAGMVMRPGETVGEWWANTSYPDRPDEDVVELYMADVDPEVTAESLRRSRDPAPRALREPWPLASWPDVPTRFIACRDDRLFEVDWLRGVVSDRLGIQADVMPGSHMVALSRPAELAARLDSYWSEEAASG